MENKKKKYFGNRNLNKRNYYNKEKLIRQSEIQNINIEDFTINILGKSRSSFREVFNDKNGKKRLYIGKYINAKLPIIYIEKNSEEIYIMSEKNINKVALTRGIYILEEDKEDLIQDCISYVMENGNMLDKNGNPIIVNEFTSNHNKNKIAKKIYYYAMRIIENYRKENTYIENIQYKDNCKENLEDKDLKRCIYENISDKMEREIFFILCKRGNNEKTKQYILEKYLLSMNQLNEIMDRIRKSLQNKVGR